MSTSYENTEQIALKILQSGVNLPPLPAVLTRLLALSRQPEDKIDIGKFTNLLQSDPALTARILQLANSSYYEALIKITNLRQAIMHIGLQETIATVNWMLCQKILPHFPVMEGFSDKDYWAHSWACATANRMLGRPDLGVRCQPGELYVTGLLQGIGRLILALHKPVEFRQCLENSRDFSQPLEEAEIDILGTTDSHVAYEILKTWHFPDSICNGVKFHKNPEDADEQYREIAALTQFAYFIANTSGIGNNGDEFSYDLNDTFLAKQQDSPFSRPEIRDRLVHDIQQTLQKKATAFTGADLESDQEYSARDEIAIHDERVYKKRKSSLFTRWLKYLRNLFS